MDPSNRYLTPLNRSTNVYVVYVSNISRRCGSGAHSIGFCRAISEQFASGSYI